MENSDLIKMIQSYNQAHLLKYYDELDNHQKNTLLNQIQNIDFELIQSLYNSTKNKDKAELDYTLAPISPLVKNQLQDSDIKKLDNLGNNAISKGEVAVLLIAGGQGTRLGYEGPKGAFDLGLGDGTTLFRLQANQIKDLSKQNNSIIPWFIMTSPQNDKATKEYFHDNNYFDLGMENIFFFQQEQMPSITPDGKIILKSKYEISLNPNGHGGCISALRNYKLIDIMKKNGIKYVFFGSVDNFKAQMADPLLIGACIEQDVDIAAKCIKKTNPNEKVGVFAIKNDIPSIVEYTEISDFHKHQLDEDNPNELAYRCANINAFVFKLEFLERALEGKEKYHIAFKKIPCINEVGESIIPEKENGFKFESLYFDYFDFAKNIYLLEVEREKEFVPIKNLKGVDSLESALKFTLLD